MPRDVAPGTPGQWLARAKGKLALARQPLPDAVQDADLLTVYATQTRYPGMSGQVGRDDYEKALATAEAVVAWATRLLEGPAAR